MAGIYIHIPFCKSFCTYCGFYSVKGRGREDKFIAALQKEILYKKDFFKQTGVFPETLYIGGGTPSVLLAGRLACVAEAVKEGFGLLAEESSGTVPGTEDKKETEDAGQGRSLAGETGEISAPNAGKKGGKERKKRSGETVRKESGNDGERNTAEKAGNNVGNNTGDNAGGNRITEFTVEVNPNDITPEYVQALAALGVNRVSMGVQSFIDRHLKWMNRRHTAAQGEQAYRILRENGIRNISLDLIFGYEGLSPEDWEYNLDRALSLAPEHISAYQMSVEPGSVLSSMVRRGEYRVPPEEVCGMQYRRLQNKLAEAGYEQYEVSNFARIIPGNGRMSGIGGRAGFSSGVSGTPTGISSGWRSRHNSSYWDKSPYLGLGPSAHSYDGRKRSWNGNSLKRYCEYYMNMNADESYAGSEILSPADSFNESLMLGLRRKEGVFLEELDRSLLDSAVPDIKRMQSAGNLIICREGRRENGGTEIVDGEIIDANCLERALKNGEKLSGYKIVIPSAKWFVSDGIIRELFILRSR